MFAHRGNLLRHMALHDPDNPGNKELLEEADVVDQTEGYEEEEIGLDAQPQIIQTVSKPALLDAILRASREN